MNGIEVNIIRKNIKNIHLYVKSPDGRIEVTAPHNAKESVILSFIELKKEWILKQQEKIRNNSENAVIRYESDEDIFVFGKKYKLIVRNNQKKNSVQLFDGYLIMNIVDDKVDKSKLINDFYRKILSEKIPGIMNDFENITEFHPSCWSIRDMKTRWGTCNVKTKKIWLSLMLAKKPLICVEYVVIHELIHLAVPNHGKDFKAYLNKYMPDWKYRRNLLNGKSGDEDADD